MKIAFVGYGIAPEVLAGTEWATFYLAKYLTKMGHQVEVLVATTQCKKPLVSNREGFVKKYVVAPRIPLVKTWQFVQKGIQELRRFQPDCIHGQAILPGGFVAVLAGRKLGCPSIVHVQGRDYLWSSWKLKPWVRFTLRSATQVLTTTEYLRCRIREDFDEVNPKIIPNGVEVQKENLELGKRDADVPRILFVGRLVAEKGVRYLLDAFAQLSQQYPSAELCLVGDGPERKNLERKVAERRQKSVFFLGAQPQEQVMRLMEASTMLVLPSTFEPFGTVLLEAMSAGLPVVASRIMGIPEMVVDEENGFLVEPQSSNDLHRAMQFLLDHPEVRFEMGKRNREKAQSYSWEILASRLETIYQECFQRKCNESR